MGQLSLLPAASFSFLYTTHSRGGKVHNLKWKYDKKKKKLNLYVWDQWPCILCDSKFGTKERRYYPFEFIKRYSVNHKTDQKENLDQVGSLKWQHLFHLVHSGVVVVCKLIQRVPGKETPPYNVHLSQNFSGFRFIPSGSLTKTPFRLP